MIEKKEITYKKITIYLKKSDIIRLIQNNDISIELISNEPLEYLKALLDLNELECIYANMKDYKIIDKYTTHIYEYV